jgi:hypothetical protein
MSVQEAQPEPVPTSVEARHQQEPDQFQHLLGVEERLRAAAGDEDPQAYLRDNFLVFMSAVAQEGQSADHDVRAYSYNTPHQLTYMQLWRSLAEAGEEYQRGKQPETSQPTVYHALFRAMLEQIQQQDAVSLKPHDLPRQLALGALHMRVIHKDQTYATVADLKYRHLIEQHLITPLAAQALASGRPIHPNLADAHDQPEALSVLVRASAKIAGKTELPNLV